MEAWTDAGVGPSPSHHEHTLCKRRLWPWGAQCHPLVVSDVCDLACFTTWDCIDLMGNIVEPLKRARQRQVEPVKITLRTCQQHINTVSLDPARPINPRHTHTPSGGCVSSFSYYVFPQYNNKANYAKMWQITAHRTTAAWLILAFFSTAELFAFLSKQGRTHFAFFLFFRSVFLWPTCPTTEMIGWAFTPLSTWLPFFIRGQTWSSTHSLLCSSRTSTSSFSPNKGTPSGRCVCRGLCLLFFCFQYIYCGDWKPARVVSSLLFCFIN